MLPGGPSSFSLNAAPYGNPQPHTQPQPHATPATAAHAPSTAGTANGGAKPSPPRSRWRHPLPDDFLVLPPSVLQLAGDYAGAVGAANRDGNGSHGGHAGSGRDSAAAWPYMPNAGSSSGGGGGGSASASGSGPLSQVEQDEMLAQMLQNELFVEQLRTDPEFAAYLRTHPDAAAALGLSGAIQAGAHGSGSGSGSGFDAPMRAGGAGRGSGSGTAGRAGTGSGASDGSKWLSDMSSGECNL